MALSVSHRMLDVISRGVWRGSASWQLRCTQAHANDMARRVALQQFRRLMEGGQNPSPMLTVAVAANILLWVVAFWLIGSATFALTWGTVACSWLVVRTRLSSSFREAQPRDEQLGLWEARVRRLDVLGGCVWGAVGAVGLLAPQEAAAYAPYLALGELLVIGPALSTCVIHRPAIVWMAVPCTLLTTLGLVLFGGLLNTCVGLGFTVAVVLLVWRALTIHELITQSMLAAEERGVLLQEHEAQRSAALADHQGKARFLSSVSESLDAPMQLIERLDRHLSDGHAMAQDEMRQMNMAVLDMDRLLTALLDEAAHSLGRPASAQAASSAPCAPADAQCLRGQLVLLVDDDPLALRGMQTLLQGMGCEVLCAESAEVALQTVEAQLRTPDMMVSDYRLGGAKTGLDAIAEVRELIGEAIPAWLVSADLNLPAEQALSRGIHVLPKPVRGDVLAVQMERAVTGLMQ